MNTVTCNRKQLAEKLIHLDGKPFSLVNYEPIESLYLTSGNPILLFGGRQISKSVTLCNYIVTNSIGQPHFKTLYISPSKEQTSRFSTQRLGKVLNWSPLIKKHFCSFNHTNNVFNRMISNGSRITLGYVTDEADRIRGIDSDQNVLDEIQDINWECIPVIQECLSAPTSKKLELYAGTPKTTENSIQYLWDKYSQNEWVVKCTHCNKHNILGEKNIGKVGVICASCYKDINVRYGKWISFNKEHIGFGYRIPQLAIPGNVEFIPGKPPHEQPWNRILQKRENYPASKFRNEVLALSDSLGQRMISETELKSLCQDDILNKRKPDNAFIARYRNIVAGIDWSGGGELGLSKTVLTIMGIHSNRHMDIIFSKIYPVGPPLEYISDIVRIMRDYGVKLVVGDAGEGMVANAKVKEEFGSNKVVQARYVSSTKAMRWNGEYSYSVNRTIMIDSYMMSLKKATISFPSESNFTSEIKHILAMHEEVTTMGMKVWRNSPNNPADALHSQVFCYIASRILYNDFNFYNEVLEEDFDYG